jgi:aminomethyltransferase
MNILFVCTGNTCRSPIAEAILRHMAGRRHQARSAGVAACPGSPVNEKAAQALAEIGVEHTGRSAHVDGALLEWADLVVCMETYHCDAILLDHPQLGNKIRTLAEWAGEPARDVHDPFGGEPEAYRKTRDEIERLIRKGLDRIEPRTEETMTETVKTTPLTAAHKRLGAKMAPFAGYEMPIQYQGILAEHKAVRERAGIFDVSHMGHAHVTDRSVSRLLSRPLERAAIGKSCYALIMTPEGGIVDDCIFYGLTDGSWHIVLNASRKDVDVATLKSVMPLSRLSMIALQGPQALEIAGEICPRRGCAERANVLGIEVELTARTGYTGEDGYEFMLDASKAEALWTRLMEKGAMPCGLGARDLLRVEAGLPLYGSDIDTTTDPFETGLSFAVELDGRDDFIAGEALRRRKDGARRRAGLTVPKGAVPRHGYAVVDADGRDIGVVTSGTYSPLLERGLALALVEKNAHPAAIRIRGADCHAEEVPLPFYRRRR